MAVVAEDTYRLVFESDLEARVTASKAATAALGAQFTSAKASLKSLQDAANEELFAKSPIAKARADVKSLGDQFKASAAEAKAAEKAMASAVKATDKARAGKINDLFNTSLGDLAARKIAESFGKGTEETKAIEGVLSRGGEALAKGATVALAAATAIAAAGIGLAASGVKYGIEQSDQRRKNVAVLDKLTGGQGALAEEVSKSLAAQTGTGEDVAMERVKGLIQAKFGQGDTESIFKASADIGAVKGAGSAETFIGILEKVQQHGSATEKSLKGLEGVGVSREDVITRLQQQGESLQSVEARLKAGKVAAVDFARAAAASVTADLGGVAGKGLDASLNRLKIGFGDLFDDFDLGPIDSIGEKLAGALGGPEGAQLKASITEAGDAALGLVKNITAADIKSVFSAASSAAKTLATGIEEAAGAAAKLYNFAKQISGSGSHMEAGSSGDAIGDAIEQEINAGNRRAAIREMEIEKARAAKEKASAAGQATGEAMADGLAKGIEANAGKAAAAMAAATKGAAQAGNAAVKVQSPSKVTGETGRFMDEGVEVGIRANADKPIAAARDVATGTARGFGGGAGGFANAGGSAGGGAIAVSFAPVFTFASSTPSDVRAELQRAVAELTPEMMARFLAALRQSQRAGREGPRS